VVPAREISLPYEWTTYPIPEQIEKLTEPDGAEYLTWDVRLPSPVQEAVSPTFQPTVDAAACFNDFVRLATSGDILRFAQRYGVLYICRHTREWKHGGIAKNGDLCADCHGKYWQGIWLEPVSAWLIHSRQLSALLKLAIEVRHAAVLERQFLQDVSLRDLKALRNVRMYLPGTEPVRQDTGARLLRQATSVFLDEIFGAAALSPSSAWLRGDEKGSEFATLTLQVKSLMGVLAVGLFAALKSPQGPHLCSYCGNPYTVQEGEKAPDSTGKRAHYCYRCRERDYAVVRAAKKKQRDQARRTSRTAT
jgi:hypothetical protein